MPLRPDDEHGAGDSPTIAEIQVAAPFDDDIALDAVKVAVAKPADVDVDHSAVDEPSRGPSISTTAEHASDAASVHSMPLVRVTEPPSPHTHRPSPLSTEPSLLSSSRLPPPSPSRSNTLQDEPTTPTSTTSAQRRARHRSAIEPRSSNRLSGFFTSLIHRRDPPSAYSSRELSAQEQPDSTAEAISRASSPAPPPRPTTPPPPSLPPPTLHELGLSLAALTSDLSPSHFSTPPSSGAFLAPHYLLLCHAQGLDVLPLISPPALQPYALVRRVSFKSVVVMEQRGVLVAIAGRRDGVRVYALEEVKKAIEWRIEMEVKRERDRLRRENIKKMALRTIDPTVDGSRDSTDKARKASLSTPPPGETDRSPANLLRKHSASSLPLPPSSPPSPPPVPLIPRSATRRTPKKRAPSVQIPTDPPGPSGQPPPYTSPVDVRPQPTLDHRPSFVSLPAAARARGNSVSNVLATPLPAQTRGSPSNDDTKADWAESSDEEAIDVVAAGPSGRALDERTSASLSPGQVSQGASAGQTVPVAVLGRAPAANSMRRNRPSNLDLSLAHSTAIPPPEPSPAPTLITLRQALSHNSNTSDTNTNNFTTQGPSVDLDEDEEDIDGHISLAQALLESRIPDLPPLGTRRPQEPILFTPSDSTTRLPTDPPSPETDNNASVGRSNPANNNRRRRRWSIMISSSPTAESESQSTAVPSQQTSSRFSRANSFRSNHSTGPAQRSATEPMPASAMLALIEPPTSAAPNSSRSSRFLPRLINTVLHGRNSDERQPVQSSSPVEAPEGTRWTASGNQAPPPKLEYVKLPGTKGALLVKAVETVKKSFLAILCGENGEKVELFAGTYRTALVLSRTFILPDSPRSLELQLQGDDLVEVFLVFAQNVFGLEPATVRVREVRIGRAERRAARRRARENRQGTSGEAAANDGDPDDDTNVNVSIGVSIAAQSESVSDVPQERSGSPTLVANEHPGVQDDRPPTPEASSTAPPSEELAILATTQNGPYTTFQQLGFSPRFPLASIADEYIIPPTYPSVLEHKARHEAESSNSSTTSPDPAQMQFSPPGLPVPTPTAPSKWFYRDPKNVIHGPWKASLMQAWYKDGLLPPDLPVRREEDTEYLLLKDLRLQSVDPTQPFRTVIPPAQARSPVASTPVPTTPLPQEAAVLLSPISLLSQPRHFGPPALFFSSRGGHSTAIVDARGRSVLKGKFFWTNDDDDASKLVLAGKMGDIKRLEAFDVSERSVLVALRQGGLEVVDLSDALLKPADESRTHLPHYSPPMGSISRRKPYIWKIGTPVTPSAPLAASSANAAKGSLGYASGKKASVSSTKGPISKGTDAFAGDIEIDPQDEVLYLGRKEDEVYFCERNAATFRILRLSPAL